MLTRVNSYVHPWPWDKDRAIKQAKAVAAGSDKSSHTTGRRVAIAKLDPVVNKALWERTERIAKEKGIAHTLPYIILDGHTRKFGWVTFHDGKFKDFSPVTVEGKNVPLFSRPDHLAISVHQGRTDEGFYQLVQEYCNGVSKITNTEANQMAQNKAEFAPSSKFVRDDSWKTAYRTVDRKWGKDLEAAVVEFQPALKAIDALNVQTKQTAGERAAMLKTFTPDDVDKWVAFWTDYTGEETNHSASEKIQSRIHKKTLSNAEETLEALCAVFKKYSAE